MERVQPMDDVPRQRSQKQICRSHEANLRELKQLRELEREVKELLPHLGILLHVDHRNTAPYLAALVATRQFIAQRDQPK